MGWGFVWGEGVSETGTIWQIGVLPIVSGLWACSARQLRPC